VPIVEGMASLPGLAGLTLEIIYTLWDWVTALRKV